MIIAITEFKLSSFFNYPKAIKLANNARKEAELAKGFIYLKTGGKGFMILRTLSAWDNLENMKTYVKMPAHLECMKQTAQIASYTKTIHVEMNEIPDWKQAFEILYNKKP